jgi:hypothetical protein
VLSCPSITSTSTQTHVLLFRSHPSVPHLISHLQRSTVASQRIPGTYSALPPNHSFQPRHPRRQRQLSTPPTPNKKHKLRQHVLRTAAQNIPPRGRHGHGPPPRRHGSSPSYDATAHDDASSSRCDAAASGRCCPAGIRRWPLWWTEILGIRCLGKTLLRDRVYHKIWAFDNIGIA